MVSVQWIKECAQCASVLSIALACTGQWQAALGATAASWIIYFDARASTAREQPSQAAAPNLNDTMRKPTLEQPSALPSASARGSALPRPIRRVIFWTVAPFVGLVWGIAGIVKDSAALIEKEADKFGYWLDR